MINNNPQNLNQLYQAVGKIQGTVEAMDKKLDDTIKNHEDRINITERKVDNMKGAVSVIGGIAGVIGSAIIGFLFKKF